MFVPLRLRGVRLLPRDELLVFEGRLYGDLEALLDLEREALLDLEREARLEGEREAHLEREREARLHLEREACLDLEREDRLEREREDRLEREREGCFDLEREDRLDLEREREGRRDREREREALLVRERERLLGGGREGAGLSRTFSSRRRSIDFTSSCTPRVISSSSEELMYFSLSLIFTSLFTIHFIVERVITPTQENRMRATRTERMSGASEAKNLQL